jgi:hypothetical protein
VCRYSLLLSVVDVDDDDIGKFFGGGAEGKEEALW